MPSEPALPGRPEQPPAPREVAVVLNPHAARGRALRAWPALQRELRARRLEFHLVMADSAQGALAALRELPQHLPVLAAGGDGTVRAVLPAIVGTGRPLGVIPLGSGNDFASLLGLRSGDHAGALSRLSGRPRPTDALWADAGQGRATLLNGLGMGFDAFVASLMPLAPARLSGFGRYTWSALRGLRGYYQHEVQLTLDGAVVHAGPSPLVAVMNGARYGGGFRISPRSDPRDGRLDVVLGTRLARRELLSLMGAVTRGAHLADPRVRHWQGREAELRWSHPTHLHLDGDVSGLVECVRVGVMPGAALLY